MMKLIDKDKVVAEIEKRKSELQSRIAELGTFESNTLGLFQDVDLYDDILSFLDTLEVKESSYDEALERARKEYKDYEAFNSFREMLVRIFPELRENDDNLKKEIIRVSKNEYFDFTDWKSIARHFYEFGLTQKGE